MANEFSDTSHGGCRLYLRYARLGERRYRTDHAFCSRSVDHRDCEVQRESQPNAFKDNASRWPRDRMDTHPSTYSCGYRDPFIQIAENAGGIAEGRYHGEGRRPSVVLVL